MRLVLMIMILSTAIPIMGWGQQWQTLLSLETRMGYSSNSYLNPFLAEWDPGLESAYNLTSVTGQTYWYRQNSSVGLTAGVMYEPVFETGTGSWKGAFGVANYNYRISRSFTAGLEAGTSYLRNSYSRTTSWIQPKVTWFVSPFTQLRLKAGSNYRNYRNYPDGGDELDRFDLYAFEFETWPDYRWQIRAGLYGGLKTLPSVQEGYNFRTSAMYFFRAGASVQVSAAIEQYQTELTNGGGGPPGPPGGPSAGTTLTDRMMRFGVTGSMPIDRRISLFGTAEVLQFTSDAATPSQRDYQVSAGIRFNIEPKFKSNKNAVSPEWNMEGRNQEVRIRYSGEGRLYLVGDFNDWSRIGIPLRRYSGNVYTAELSLSPGAYEYKILRVLGDSEEWLQFSDNVYTVGDGFGNVNAMLLVE